MTVEKFIVDQQPENAKLMAALHNIILSQDNVSASVGSMMGKEMILYTDEGMFKYGLANVKNYLSLHLLPMYMNPVILERYKALLPQAKFQKGCINFNNEKEMPPTIVSKLIKDCSKVDLLAIKNKYQQTKKKKA